MQQVMEHNQQIMGPLPYQWDAMTDEVNNYNTSVAKLIYHLGIAVEMNYAADGSGSQTADAATALKNLL